MATTFSEGVSTKISQKRKIPFTLQTVLVSNFKVKIQNQDLKTDPCTKFLLNGTKTENGHISGLFVIKFKYDVMLTSQLVI